MKLYIKRKFAAAHYLPDHPGPCKNMHGHTFQSEIFLEGPLNQGTGMVIDFSEIKEIIDTCDHVTLNEVLPEKYLPPTAENLALYFLEEIPYAVRVRVWESSSACAEAEIRGPVELYDDPYVPGVQKWESPTRKWLQHHYTELEKSPRGIAQLVGCSRSLVEDWLQKLHIPQRTIGRAISLSKMGVKNPRWRGGSLRTCRRQATRVLEESGTPKVCERCQRTTSETWIEVHHLDGDECNNALGNLQWLCRSCHMYTRREVPNVSRI